MAFNLMVPKWVIQESQQTCDAGNMGNRDDGSDGTKEQQLVGIIGQNMLHLALGKPLMQAGGGFDGGIDAVIFGMSFDIKTMGRTTAPRIDFVNNLLRSQTRYNVQGYIFASLNKNSNVLSICGWLPKEAFIERAELHMRGSTRTRADGTPFEMKADNYEICNQDLFHRSRNWPELFVEIYHYSG